MKPITITSENYKTEVVNSTDPVFADFSATWCGPCRALAPIVDSLVDQYAGKLKFVEIDTDKNPDLAAKFNISSIPTLLILENGERTSTVGVGLIPRAQLETTLDAFLASSSDS
ncbi:MAG: thioredoxin [Elusimicrobia bacterium]|nr:MAG: thioredoxin [Elusimicrobiota bacterium]